MVCGISRFSSKYYILWIVPCSGEGDGTSMCKSSKLYLSLEPPPIEAILRILAFAIRAFGSVEPELLVFVGPQAKFMV